MERSQQNRTVSTEEWKRARLSPLGLQTKLAGDKCVARADLRPTPHVQHTECLCGLHRFVSPAIQESIRTVNRVARNACRVACDEIWFLCSINNGLFYILSWQFRFFALSNTEQKNKKAKSEKQIYPIMAVGSGNHWVTETRRSKTHVLCKHLVC